MGKRHRDAAKAARAARREARLKLRDFRGWLDTQPPERREELDRAQAVGREKFEEIAAGMGWDQ